MGLLIKNVYPSSCFCKLIHGLLSTAAETEQGAEFQHLIWSGRRFKSVLRSLVTAPPLVPEAHFFAAGRRLLRASIEGQITFTVRESVGFAHLGAGLVLLFGEHPMINFGSCKYTFYI